ncbi:hypothetical protein D3C81_2148380 [compost metagenome]
MSDKELSNNGYQPTSSERVERGYQPVLDTPHQSTPNGGYQPTGAGDNPTNVPSPPKER